MKTIPSLILATSWLFTVSTHAEKPAWAGSGKPTAEQKEAHKAAMNAKEDDLGPNLNIGDNPEVKKAKDKTKKVKKVQKNNESLLGSDKEQTRTGLEKQHAKKAGQEQKELGKGSEQGQESREQRKKWWQFWE